MTHTRYERGLATGMNCDSKDTGEAWIAGQDWKDPSQPEEDWALLGPHA